MIKVSIIIPVYNVEKYLKKCLTSITKQTLKDIEIICINDGSSDSSLKILNEFKSKDIRISVINQDNQGQACARNNGIKVAQGEYIGFVDADDWVDSDFFEKLYLTAKNANADIACAGYKRCTIGGGSVRKSFNKITETYDINTKLKLDNLPQDNYIWNKIYRLEKWKEIAIHFPENRLFEDIAIVIKLLNSMGKMVTVPNTYYHYRRRKDSTIALYSAKKEEDYKWAENELFNYANINNIPIEKPNNIIKREYVKIFKLTFIKVLHFKKGIKYNLFGFIPFAEIVKKQ